MFRYVVVVGIVFAMVLVPAAPANARVTPEQKKKLASLRKELLKASPLIRKKDFDEAKAIVEGVATKVEEMGFEKVETDRVLRGLQSQLQQIRSRFPVSFEHDVAPIITQRCLNCHGADSARSRLRMDTFAGIRKGGQGGRLFLSGNAQRSRIMARITAKGNERMPKQGKALSTEQIQTIGRWINQGARYDGTDARAMIGTTKLKGPKPVIAMADGSETVSFSRDIAPFMNNICVRCHGGNNPRSGFSLETFEKLMQGGDSGVLVVGGDLEASRLWDLAGKQDPIKMPPGQALITRSNHRNLRIWIEEGAKFDGKDSKATLASLAASASAASTAATEPAEVDWNARRSEQAMELWKKALPRDESDTVESDEFIIVGNVDKERLDLLGQWADEHAKSLRRMFRERGDTIWKGRLIVFVADDRFGYEEFNQVLLKRQTPRGMAGHSVVTADQNEAYVVLEDTGDEPTASEPDVKSNLIEQLTAAFLQRSGPAMPAWLLRGAGLALAAQKSPKNAWLRALPRSAAGSVRGLNKPEDIFRDGTFSPAEVGPVGFVIVRHLLQSAGPTRFGQFVNRIGKGENVTRAIGSVYRAKPGQVATGVINSLR